MAPLEEVTEAIYRNAYHAFFFPMDKYFAPFISAKPNKGRLFNYRENGIFFRKIIKICILFHRYWRIRAKIFKNRKRTNGIWIPRSEFKSGLSVKTGGKWWKRFGIFRKERKLKQFLDEIFDKCPIEISIKTRLGRYHEEEIDELFELFLIILMRN